MSKPRVQTAHKLVFTEILDIHQTMEDKFKAAFEKKRLATLKKHGWTHEKFKAIIKG